MAANILMEIARYRLMQGARKCGEWENLALDDFYPILKPPRKVIGIGVEVAEVEAFKFGEHVV
jgi:hypothetical protein